MASEISQTERGRFTYMRHLGLGRFRQNSGSYQGLRDSGGNRELLLNGYKFPFGMMKKF